MADKLREAGSVFYEWNPESLPEAERLSGNEVLIRLVTSFLTRADEVAEFLSVAEAATDS
jgi:threonine aldolase